MLTQPTPLPQHGTPACLAALAESAMVLAYQDAREALTDPGRLHDLLMGEDPARIYLAEVWEIYQERQADQCRAFRALAGPVYSRHADLEAIAQALPAAQAALDNPRTLPAMRDVLAAVVGDAQTIGGR